MAANGILEGYLMARCSSRWMIRVQVAHVCFFGIFCLLVYMLKGIGLHAVIYATSVSMFLRCVLAVYFIRYGEEKENPKAKEGDGKKPVEKAKLSLGRIIIAALLLLASGQVCGRILSNVDISGPIPIKQIGIASGVAACSIGAVGLFAWKFCGLQQAVRLLREQKKEKAQ